MWGFWPSSGFVWSREHMSGSMYVGLFMLVFCWGCGPSLGGRCGILRSSAPLESELSLESIKSGKKSPDRLLEPVSSSHYWAYVMPLSRNFLGWPYKQRLKTRYGRGDRLIAMRDSYTNIPIRVTELYCLSIWEYRPAVMLYWCWWNWNDRITIDIAQSSYTMAPPEIRAKAHASGTPGSRLPFLPLATHGKRVGPKVK